MMGIEFTCRFCRFRVFTATMSEPPEHGLCFRCSFLETAIPDPAERREVLDYLDRDMATDA